MPVTRYVHVIVGLVFLVVAAALWAMPSNSRPVPDKPAPAPVVLDRVRLAQSRPVGRFGGVTQAKNRAVLSFAVPARVTRRSVEPGSRVAQGDPLARLDDREFRNAVNMARAAVAELKTQWAQAARDRRRIAKLAASHVATVSDLEKITTRGEALGASLQAAATRLKEARRQLDETVLKAPFSGTVTRVRIQPGEWAVPGQPAIELTGDGDVELVVEVPESVAGRLSAGQPVQVLLPFAGDRRVPGRIGSVAKAALAAGRLFPVKVDLDAQAGVGAGLTARLVLNLPAEGVLTVPLTAVVNPGASQPYIFIYHQGRVGRRDVVLGPIIQDRIAVRGDLSQGDQVVISGQNQLADGDQVEAAL
jgi:RND family efflux transporter MFP subunit